MSSLVTTSGAGTAAIAKQAQPGVPFKLYTVEDLEDLPTPLGS